jgi:mono/diheme cytochrome c family protein
MHPRLLLAVFSLVVPAATFAAADGSSALERGETVYRESCATGYCHGVDGSMAGAPRLLARGFDAAYIRSVVSDGVKGTSMAGFAASLSREDLVAVMTYVAALNDIRDAEFFPSGGLGVAAADPRPALSAEAEQGRALFIDADKGAARCSTCHELEGLGIPVAGPMTQIPVSLAALRELPTPRVQQISVAGESMPGLMVAKGVSGVLFYDLTGVPPVLRTFPAGTSVEAVESDWQHGRQLQAYSEDELRAVLAYLGELGR